MLQVDPTIRAPIKKANGREQCGSYAHALSVKSGAVGSDVLTRKCAREIRRTRYRVPKTV